MMCFKMKELMKILCICLHVLKTKEVLLFCMISKPKKLSNFKLNVALHPKWDPEGLTGTRFLQDSLSSQMMMTTGLHVV